MPDPTTGEQFAAAVAAALTPATTDGPPVSDAPTGTPRPDHSQGHGGGRANRPSGAEGFAEYMRNLPRSRGYFN